MDTPNNKWHCQWADNSALAQTQQEIVALLEQVALLPITLKDDKRSLVKQGELFGKMVVAKQPRDKNRRKWSRLLSWVRPSEARHTFNTLQNFAEQSIESVTPIAVFEKRSFGLVVDSWLFYEYRAGNATTREDLPRVITVLDQLHRAGYQHNDPHFGNFLIDDDNTLFLIDCKGKRRLSTLTDHYDYLLLSQRNADVSLADIGQHIDLSQQTIGHRLAHFYAGYKNLRNTWKRRWREKRGTKR